jgi:hypothetical protein
MHTHNPHCGIAENYPCGACKYTNKPGILGVELGILGRHRNNTQLASLLIGAFSIPYKEIKAWTSLDKCFV